MAQTAETVGEVPSFTIPTGGDDGGDGASTSSGSSAASAAATEAKKEQERIKAAKKAFRGVLYGLRINPGPYGDLIDRAAKDDWEGPEFLFAISKSKPFKSNFPSINSLFKQGMSVTTAVSSWRQQAAAYRDTVANLSYQKYPLTPKKIGWLIKNNVSPERLAIRLQIEEALKAPGAEAFQAAFNSYLSKKQLNTLDKKGMFRFLAGEGDRELYDHFEAAKLEVSGLSFQPGEALALAQQLGPAGELVGDIGELITAVNAIKDVAAPEFEREGITDADLVLFNSGSDPKGLTPKIDRIVKQRKSLAEAGSAAPRRRTGQGVPVLSGVIDEGL